MAMAVPPDPLSGLRDDLLVETQFRNRIQQRLASVASWREVPEFVDADFALGRYALRDRESPNQDEAL
jgi:hypothetical protein